MPRAFDSDAAPDRLDFTENVICGSCDEIFEGFFFDYTQSLAVEDMTEPPVGHHCCPGCGLQWSSELTGWMFYSEAG